MLGLPELRRRLVRRVPVKEVDMAKTKGASGFGWLRKAQVKDRINGGKRWVYYASYLNPFDKEERIKAPHAFDYKMDARQWLDAEHKLISSGQRTHPNVRAKAALEAREVERSRRMTFGDYAERWFERNVSRWKPRTEQTYRQLLDAYILPVFGETPLNEISVDDVGEWYDELANTPSARGNSYGLLKQILDVACTPPNPILAFNPCQIKGGARHAGGERPVAAPEQVAKLADAMPDKYRLAVLLAAWLSLRSGEVRALRKSDFDLKKRTVHIQHNVTYTKQHGFVDSTPKTAAGNRVVAIPSALIPEIREHIKRYAGKDKDALLFCTGTGNYLHQTEIEKPFIEARKQAGCPELRFHDLRHTGNTFAIQTGVATVADLQKRGGWTTPTMALHYAHSTLDRQQQIADALDKVMRGENPKRDGEDLTSMVKQLLEENKRLSEQLAELGAGKRE